MGRLNNTYGFANYIQRLLITKYSNFSTYNNKESWFLSNWQIELAYLLWGGNAPGQIGLTFGAWLSLVHIT